MAKVKLFLRVETENCWRNAALDRETWGRIKWLARGRYLIE